MGEGRRHRGGKAAAEPLTSRRFTKSTGTFSETCFRQEDLPMPSLRLLAPALFALAFLGATAPASADSFTDSQRTDIEAIVRNYLVTHPEVLEEAMTELSKRQTAAEAQKHEASIEQNANAIFNSPRQVVLGNKDGDVTFVEFFDYNCGYCKRAMADMLDLMKSDPKLKVVLKEFPVLSQGSVEAAQVAVAVRMQDPTGKKYLDFHQKLLGGRGQADKAHAMAAAKEAGLDTARIEKDLANPEVRATIEENFKLAEAMGMNGTPSYVIGKQIVVGAIGLEGLKEKIGIARCGKAAC
jgi:protein-disulfide isomerase